MGFIKKFGFFAMATMLSLSFIACHEEEVVVEEGPEYTHTDIVFMYDYSGKIYDLIDVTHEVVFNEGTEPVKFFPSEEEGRITISFTGVQPLSSISVKIINERNSNPIDMADGIAYDHRDTPRFSITRYFDDGSFETGGEIHSGSTNATGLNKNTLEEYIIEHATTTFTVKLTEEGFLDRTKEPEL